MKLTLLGSILFYLLTGCIFILYTPTTAVDAEDKMNKDILNYKLNEFSLNNESLQEGLKRITQKHGVVFTIEILSPLKKLSFSLKNPSLREVLDYLIKLDDRYTYVTYKNSIINFIPVNFINNDAYFINTIIPNIKVEEKTRDEILDYLFSFNEIKNAKIMLFSTSFGLLDKKGNKMRHSFTLENIITRDILNEIALLENSSWAITKPDGYVLSFGGFIEKMY